MIIVNLLKSNLIRKDLSGRNKMKTEVRVGDD